MRPENTIEAGQALFLLPVPEQEETVLAKLCEIEKTAPCVYFDLRDAGEKKDAAISRRMAGLPVA